MEVITLELVKRQLTRDIASGAKVKTFLESFSDGIGINYYNRADARVYNLIKDKV